VDFFPRRRMASLLKVSLTVGMLRSEWVLEGEEHGLSLCVIDSLPSPEKSRHVVSIRKQTYFGRTSSSLLCLINTYERLKGGS
jgi:hypothetical protein